MDSHTMMPPTDYEQARNLIESVEGYLMAGQEQYLFDKVRALPENAAILEIGSFKGRSTVAMGLAALGSGRRIYCIDTWDGNENDFTARNFFAQWKENVSRCGVTSVVTPIVGYSHEVLARWTELTKQAGIDFVFIDGSHDYEDVLRDLQMVWPLVKDYGWIALHDVHYTWPGPLRVWFEWAKPALREHEYVGSLACGRKPPGVALTKILSKHSVSQTEQLPIHFFTCVLNGMPYIRHHIGQMKQLACKWHWHVVEGVAELKRDTAWSLARGGNIPQFAHTAGRSNDGTTQYLDQLQQEFPDAVTVYRKPLHQFWNGKVEMVNQPAMVINEPCLLWEIDADELWTAQQYLAGRQLFLDEPAKTAAYYWCWCFVGPQLVISSRYCYANNPKMEWLRTWRFRPGMQWLAHEPPILAEADGSGRNRDVGQSNPILHDQTEAAGLVFQHYAYAIREQVRFKEKYYGYSGAERLWENLQQVKRFPVYLRDYFPWVKDHTQVDRCSKFIPFRLIELPDSQAPQSSSSCDDLTANMTEDPVAMELYIQAVDCRHCGDVTQAESFCRQAVAKQPQFVRALNLLAYLCHGSGKVAEAVDILTRIVEMQPNVAGLYNNLAAMLGASGQLEKSATVLRQAMDLRPDYFPSYFNLGITLSKLSRFEPAAEVFRRSLFLGSTDPMVHVQLAHCLLKLGKHAEAEASLRTALTQDGPCFPAQEQLAKLLREQGRLTR